VSLHRLDVSGGSASLFSRAGQGEFVEWTGIIANGGTAGTVQLQWAQNTSNAANLTMKKGSYMMGAKVV
jgi:hypothetical protein